MKKILLSLVTLTLAACTTTKQEPKKSETEKINAFFERTFQERVERSPMFETRLGGKKNYDQLDDVSDEMAIEEYEIAKKELRELDQFDYNKLDEQAKISYRLFKYLGERKLRRHKFRFHNYPLNQMWGAQSMLPSFMINMHQVKTEKDAQDYIARLQEFDRFVNQVIDGISKRTQLGILPPKFVYDKVIDSAQNVIAGAPFVDGKTDSPLFADLKKKVSALKIEEQRKTDLLEAGEDALINSVKPAFQSMIRTMAQLKKLAPLQGGAHGLPNGKEFYKTALEFHTSTSMTADEIHQIGLSEVKRIKEEMRAIKSKVGFKGDLKAFFKFMKESDQFSFPQTKAGQQEYLDRSVKLIADMKEKLGLLFNIKPKADIIVKAVEPYREKSAGLAFYQSPAEDGTRPGIYYVNLSNMKAANAYEMEALAYHEGIPGHHMQLAVSTELKDIPKFRKHVWMTAYGEGWALYSEAIPKEVGAYQDPYSDFGRLAMELWRAVRLVVDTGLHAKGWTREATIDYIMANTPSVHESARKATERYIVLPGQATAYKVGMLKIQELRRKSKEMLGSRFDVRGFHDEILRNGAMPLAMLEEQIASWAQKSLEKPITIQKPAASAQEE